MADPVVPSSGFAPVAVVWCRQVDNEAESPGYTTIPEDFPGRRETLEAIRLVGNLTINVADTHDYWDPDPSQTLSYYPNLFLYPAGNGRYTCVGRMFLSTEDRPRLGMKTLVLETAPLVASGAFGPAVLQAWATMGGRPGGDKPRAEPEPAVYQAVGEGFLFHRGTTEPVVIVAADQWEAAIEATVELLRSMPTALIALGAFLIFPYFLPEGKVNLHEFAEQIPLALAVMRVPPREAQGDRHTKRILTWEGAPVSLRDLTHPPPPRTKDPLPLVLQYVRGHSDDKIGEVSRRVDMVESARLKGHLDDTDRQSGRDRRKEMWRIGTAMESAALLLARPKGRSIPMSGEAAKRANQYLAAKPPPEPAVVPLPEPAMHAPEPAAASASPLPPWLQSAPSVEVPASASVAVPVSVSDDPSVLPAGSRAPAPMPTPEAKSPPAPSAPSGVGTTVVIPVAAPPPPPPPPPPRAGPLSPEVEARLRAYVDERLRELKSTAPPPADPASLDARLNALALDLETKSNSTLERRVREATDAETRAIAAVRADLASRLAAVEARPIAAPSPTADQLTEQVRRGVDPKVADLAARIATLEARPPPPPPPTPEQLAEQLRRGVDPKLAEMAARVTALEARPPPPPPPTAEQLSEQMRRGMDPKLAEITTRVAKLEARPLPSPSPTAEQVSEQLRRGMDPKLAEITARVAALEAKPAPPPAPTAEQIVEQVRRAIDPKLVEFAERARAVDQESSDRTVALLRTELARAVEELRLRGAKGEEELRAALVAQMEIQVQEAKEQGTALREEIEGRVRELLKERLAELDPKRARELRELEARLDLLVDGRVKDLETRMSAQSSASREKLDAAGQEHLTQLERRLTVAAESRIARAVEAQTQSTAGLQVRLQSYIDQRLREDKESERDKYVELLARFKTEVDQALARTIDSDGFELAVREHVAQAMDAMREADLKSLEARISDMAMRVKSHQDADIARLKDVEEQLAQREGALADVEQGIRRDLEELDRRLSVLSERMVPLVRNTWLKVDELQKGTGLSAAAEARLKEFRREYGRELRRLEGELLEQTTELRDRVESAIAHQGRIWLNFMRQMAAADDEDDASTAEAAARSLRRAKGAAVATADRSQTRPVAPFDPYEDPVNPMDPEPEVPEAVEREPAERRRSRRIS